MISWLALSELTKSNQKESAVRLSPDHAMTVLGLLVVTVLLALPAGAIGEDAPGEHPFEYVPTYFATQVENSTTSWGEVAYFVRWDNPDGVVGLGSARSANPTLEIGIKSGVQSSNRCHDNVGMSSYFPDLQSTTGVPAGVTVTVDITEDYGDWVIWIADMDVVVQHQQSNPGSEYSFRLDCEFGVRNAEHLANGWYDDTYVEAQVGHWNNTKHPIDTYSDATMRLVPREEGEELHPDGAADGRRVYTWILSPWVRDYSFESGYSSWSTPWGVSQWIYGQYNPIHGDGYMFFRPDNPGEVGRITQDFTVRTNGTRDSQWEVGTNTGLVSDILFRCPTWSDDWAGMPGSSCGVVIYVKALNGAKANQYVAFSRFVPADNQWYAFPYSWITTKLDSLSGSAGWGDATSLRITMDSKFPMDVDAVWVSSDV